MSKLLSALIAAVFASAVSFGAFAAEGDAPAPAKEAKPAAKQQPTHAKKTTHKKTTKAAPKKEPAAPAEAK